MIDIHSHVLFGVDDGPEELEGSLEMLKHAERDGITHIVATPHFMPPRYTGKGVDEAYDLLQATIIKENIPVNLSLGNEAYLTEGLLGKVLSGECKKIAGTDFILLELPTERLHAFHEQLLYDLRKNGIKPIIAHAERYEYLSGDLGKVQTLVNEGCFIQLNASIFWKSSKKMATQLIERELVHFIASDAHNVVNRKPELKRSYDFAKKEFGVEVAMLLFTKNAERMLENKNPVTLAVKQKEKGFFKKLF